MSAPGNSNGLNGIVAEGEALDAEFKSLAVGATEEILGSAAFDLLGTAVTTTAAAQAGLNPLNDVGAGAADLAAAAKTVKAGKAIGRLENFIRDHPKEIVRLGELLEKDAGHALAGLEKKIPPEFKAVLERMPAGERKAFEEQFGSSVREFLTDFKKDDMRFSNLASDLREATKEAERQADKAELYARVTEQVNGVTEQVNGVTEQVNGVTEQVNGVTEQVNGVTEQVNGVTEQVNVFNREIIKQVVDLKAGQAELEAGQKTLVTQGEGIAKSVSFWPVIKLALVATAIWDWGIKPGYELASQVWNEKRIAMGAAFVEGRDFLTQRLFGSDLAKNNVPSPGLANAPVKAASLVLPNNPPSVQDVEYTERLWWFDKVDAEKRLQHPNDREFEARWSDTREGTSYALPVFATEKKNGTITSVNEKNVVQDLGDGKRITYRTDDLLYGLAGQERAEAFDRLKKLEHQAVELKVEARGFDAKPLAELALQQVPENSSDAHQLAQAREIAQSYSLGQDRA